MADTNHAHATDPVEGDGVSYSGIVWFVAILTATTLFCQAIVWAMFGVMEYRVRSSEVPRAATAGPMTEPGIEQGRIVPAPGAAPGLTLLVNEPTVLREFRRHEDQQLTTYGWISQPLGTIHIPIDRAKALVIERGFPVRPAVTPAAAPAPVAGPATRR